MGSWSVVVLLVAAATTAGCIDATEPGSGQGPTDGLPVPAAGPFTIPFDHNGTTALAACAFVVGVGTCAVPIQGPPPVVALRDLALGGPPLRVAGTVTWDADSPLTEEATVFLEGDGGPSPILDERRGPSPLHFDWDLVAVGGSDHVLVVHTAHFVQEGPLFAVAEAPEDVRLRGNVTWAPDQE